MFLVAYKYGEGMDTEFKFRNGTVWWNTRSIYFGNTELYDLFEKLASTPGHFFHYDTLKEVLLGPNPDLSDNSLQAQVSRLRRRLQSAEFDGVEIDGGRRHYYQLLITRTAESAAR